MTLLSSGVFDVVVIRLQQVAPCYRQMRSALGILLFGLLPLSSVAQEDGPEGGDALTATLNYSVAADSNLFRRPDSANPRSDVIHTASGSLRFDKPYSQQRFQLELTETLNRYQNTSYLDFDATNYRGAWLWRPYPWLNAKLSAERSRSLAAFEDTLGTQRNVSVRENLAFNLDGRILGGWNWLAGISRTDQKSEQAIVNHPDQRTDSTEIGLKYVTPSGNSIAAILRSSRGDYLNLSATPGITGSSFNQDESELKGNWRLSEKSELNGRIAWLERTNNQISQRNFSGMLADLGFTWKPTAKLSFNAVVNRNDTPLQDPSFSYVANEGLTLTPAWRITKKISAHMRLARTTSTYRGTGIAPTIGPARKDTVTRKEIGVDWTPWRRLSAKTTIEQQRRSSNSALYEYDDSIARLTVSWWF